MTASWVPGVTDDHPFGVHNLPYGAASLAERAALCIRIGDYALDLASACQKLVPQLATLVEGPVLNPLLAAGPPAWTALRSEVRSWLTDESRRLVIEPLLLPVQDLPLSLPFEVADYVDFYASEHHAANVGRLFRPHDDPLPENWKHLPIGYHGRAGTVVVSGTPVFRPLGQRRRTDGTDGPVFGATAALDFEVEVGFVVGNATPRGTPVPLSAAREHIFGLCLVNDWSARDIQRWESRPLGPFLGKSFATSLSPWVVPLDALDHARVSPPRRDPPLLDYLDDGSTEPWALDVELSLEINGSVISRPQFASMYWTPAQLLTHLTVNGASLRAGDLFASGTVSGPSDGELGCLLELTRNGQRPVQVGDERRTWLLDGDEVVIRGRVPATATRPEVALGEVRGRIEPPVAAGRTSPDDPR